MGVNRRKLAIFGLGLCGEALCDRAVELGWQVAGFSRSGGRGEGRRLDAADAAACDRLRKSGLQCDAAVTTFPPENASARFWSLFEEAGPRRVLLSTTGIYRRRGRRPLITEKTPLKSEHPRFEVEASFSRTGGILVRLSGLYGGPRNPLRWIERGRVGYEDRQVNLVHYRDVAAAVCELCARDCVRPLYNLADGQVHTWRQIIDFLVAGGWIEHDRLPAPQRKKDSFVDNARFLDDFPSFRFRDFWEELERLAECAGNSWQSERF